MPPNLSVVESPRADTHLPAKLTALLERFVPSISAQAMVRSALNKAERLGDHSLATVLRELESTAKILIPPSKREVALAAIRAALDAPTPATAPATAPATEAKDETVVVIRQELDVSPCRLVARETCKSVGIRGYQAQRIVTSVSELARNIAHYAGAGRVRFRIDDRTTQIRITAEDQGPGIPNLDEIFAGDYRSRTGLGRGLIGVRRLADDFDIQTGDWGTRVSVGFDYGALSR